MIHFDPFPLGHFKIDWLKFGGMIKEIDISYSTISRAERGYSVDPDHFFTLLQFVGIPFDLPETICKR